MSKICTTFRLSAAGFRRSVRPERGPVPAAEPGIRHAAVAAQSVQHGPGQAGPMRGQGMPTGLHVVSDVVCHYLC